MGKKVNALVAGKQMNDVMKMLIGKEVTITGNICNHNYGAIGTKFKVETVVGWNGTSAMLKNTTSGFAYTYIYFSDIELSPLTLEDLNKDKENISKSIEDLKKDSVEIDNRIAFMKEYNLDEFDEDLHKVNSVLTTLDKEMSNIEKAKLIAQLIKN